VEISVKENLMKVDDMVVFMDGMFPAILFPVGKPEDGGTCAYLTDHCLLYCPTQEINSHEARALEFFKENDVDTIASKLLEDVCFYSVMHLYWWSWGDCLPELVDKISSIMLKLSDLGLLQNGYTKNRELWERINFFSPTRDNLRIGFHVDTPEEAIDGSKEKVMCCPDVEVNKAELYFNGDKVARCCGIWCDWLTVAETRAADCQECYLNKQGCFIR
jgi:hypothetical protein